ASPRPGRRDRRYRRPAGPGSRRAGTGQLGGGERGESGPRGGGAELDAEGEAAACGRLQREFVGPGGPAVARGPRPGGGLRGRSVVATGPVIGGLGLQGARAEHARARSAAGARPVSVRRADEVDRVDGLVIPGGESTTMWKLAVIFDLLDPLRKRIGSGMCAFGSCAGMIMLADRLLDGVPGQETVGGIDMTVRRNAFGRQVDSFESDISLAG